MDEMTTFRQLTISRILYLSTKLGLLKRYDFEEIPILERA